MIVPTQAFYIDLTRIIQDLCLRIPKSPHLFRRHPGFPILLLTFEILVSVNILLSQMQCIVNAPTVIGRQWISIGSVELYRIDLSVRESLIEVSCMKDGMRREPACSTRVGRTDFCEDVKE